MAPRLGRRQLWGIHVFAGTCFFAFGALIALPGRLWTGIALYCGGGIMVESIPTTVATTWSALSARSARSTWRSTTSIVRLDSRSARVSPTQTIGVSPSRSAARALRQLNYFFIPVMDCLGKRFFDDGFEQHCCLMFIKQHELRIDVGFDRKFMKQARTEPVNGRASQLVDSFTRTDNVSSLRRRYFLRKRFS
jgi:hypothetical protein